MKEEQLHKHIALCLIMVHSFMVGIRLHVLQTLLTRLQVRQAELDLPVQTSRPHEGRVQGVRSVGGHQHFDVATRVKSVQLVDELQHSPLDLIVSTSSIIKTSTWQVEKHSQDFKMEQKTNILP